MTDNGDSLLLSCGDYRELLAGIADNEAALVLTDPPYGIGYRNNFTQNMHDVLIGDEDDFSYTYLAEEAWRVLRPNSAFFAFTGWSTYPTHYVEVEAAGFAMKEPLICQKRASGKTDLLGSFQSNADWVLFGHKGRFQFRPTELIRNKRAGTVPNPGRSPVAEFKKRFPSCWFGDEYPWATENPTFQKKHGLRHPTIKSQRLMEWLILLATDEGDLVVDPFMGTGTVAAACVTTGRRFYGGDISSEFFAMAAQRVATSGSSSEAPE